MSVILKTKIEEFREALTAGMDGIVRASEIYVDALDDDPRNADKFQSVFADWVPASAWKQFEAVGRKWMHPKLFMGGMSNRRKAHMGKALPYSLQERIFSGERFPLLVGGGDVMQVTVMDATLDQVGQLFAQDGLRGLPGQKSWLEEIALVGETEAATPEVMPYVIHGGSVTFRKGVRMTRAELKRLLQEM